MVGWPGALGTGVPRTPSHIPRWGRYPPQYPIPLLLKAVHPPPNQVKLIQLQVIHHAASIRAASSDPKIRGTCDMIILAYFLLLFRVEYTIYTSYITPFHLYDTTISCGNTIFYHTTNTSDLKATSFYMIELTTKKNGVRGKKIGQVELGEPLLLPIVSLLFCILYLKKQNTNPIATLAYFISPTGKLNKITHTKHDLADPEIFSHILKTQPRFHFQVCVLPVPPRRRRHGVAMRWNWLRKYIIDWILSQWQNSLLPACSDRARHEKRFLSTVESRNLHPDSDTWGTLLLNAHPYGSTVSPT